ncbi:MAG: YeeE/YedE family protein [Gammaproteobacteria bacterium]|nr:YeeE/YedE family protein [Gammaproteobacteria bacterium]
MGAVSDWINMDSLTRLRVWFLAMGVAILGAQAMHFTGMLDLTQSIYLTTNFTWLGHVLGGFIFGVGMTIASGCGQRTLVRLGGGNLKSLVVFLVMGITAYATLRGLFALLRLEINGPTTLDLTEAGLSTQGIPDLLSYLTGISTEIASIICVVVIAGGAIIFALRDNEVWTRFDNLLAGIGIGLIISGAWYITGVLGYDDFDPIQLEAVSFIAPVGNSISYVMTYTGSSINFGIAVVFGLVIGAFLYSILSGTFRLESFSDKTDFINHFLGAVMMGFGGVLSLGCTIGQGISGMSTLAIGSLLTLVFIISGSAFALKMQYYLYDDLGWGHAFKSTMRDTLPGQGE